ncbi:hypothetical protein AGDE_04336 [Angomonas deanei]|uniref:Phosphate transport (Pho88), putative n=1 Tax=Angomonas deanei TaxID=59799 RepID=S9V995_9TRYP|nr:hypothetical protein AGDE_04510 [Angomonas deanei]EPY39592.1 hypothetical protein AGDE_04336 [Angomonas deanei]CAD2215648.1 Phosphate transport (Pho88), putative [Angomonas deanei]|eukprot:EPY39418.1 hypothetical protein AGDE_04510 [Angomonas deanei]
MNLFLSFSILIFSWSIDNTDPAVQSIIRLLFFAVHAALLVVFVYIGVGIWRKGTKKMVTYRDPYTDEPTSMESWSYDAMKLRELSLTKVGLAVAISYVVSSRYGMFFPLLLQCIMNPKQVYDSELGRLYLRGQSEESHAELQRPWREQQYAPEWLTQMWKEGEKQSDNFLANNTVKGQVEKPVNDRTNRKKK